jgi:hypothetical protein
MLEQYIKKNANRDRFIFCYDQQTLLGVCQERWVTENIYLSVDQIPDNLKAQKNHLALYAPYCLMNRKLPGIRWMKYSVDDTSTEFTAGYLVNESEALFATWYPMISNGSKYRLNGEKK